MSSPKLVRKETEIEEDLPPGCKWVRGKALFSREVLREHARLKSKLASYIAGSRLMVILTAPLLYLCLVPLALSDVAVTAYQSVCFPIYGIPRVRRADYFVFDRHRLTYLNLVERLNCLYCSYANGLFAYGTEIAARTEQHWCPIKHAKKIVAPHSRYSRYLDYGAAEAYRERLETLRRDFNDVNRAVRFSSKAG